MANESSGITINGSYINGVDETKGWYTKLVEAGCSVTKTKNLKVPEGREPVEFMTSLFGSEKVAKYVSVHDLSGGTKESPKKAESTPVAEKGALRVYMDKERSNIMIVSGLTKDDAAAHKLIKEQGGKFHKESESWEIADPKVKQTEFYKSVLASINVTSVKEASTKPQASATQEEKAFSVVELEKGTFISRIKPDSPWHKKLIEAGCTITGTGSLKIPDGVAAPKFLNETLGKENILKHGGYSFTRPTVNHTTVSSHADRPKKESTPKATPAAGTAAVAKKAFEVVEKGGHAYINGIKPESPWQKKLIEAGCSITKTGGLKIPDGMAAPKFLNETLGKENILKYGGYEYTKEAAGGGKKKDETLADILKNRPEYMNMSLDDASAALAQEMAGKTASQNMQQN